MNHVHVGGDGEGHGGPRHHRNGRGHVANVAADASARGVGVAQRRHGQARNPERAALQLAAGGRRARPVGRAIGEAGDLHAHRVQAGSGGGAENIGGRQRHVVAAGGHVLVRGVLQGAGAAIAKIPQPGSGQVGGLVAELHRVHAAARYVVAAEIDDRRLGVGSHDDGVVLGLATGWVGAGAGDIANGIGHHAQAQGLVEHHAGPDVEGGGSAGRGRDSAGVNLLGGRERAVIILVEIHPNVVRIGTARGDYQRVINARRDLGALGAGEILVAGTAIGRGVVDAAQPEANDAVVGEVALGDGRAAGRYRHRGVVGDGGGGAGGGASGVGGGQRYGVGTGRGVAVGGVLVGAGGAVAKGPAPAGGHVLAPVGELHAAGTGGGGAHRESGHGWVGVGRKRYAVVLILRVHWRGAGRGGGAVEIVGGHPQAQALAQRSRGRGYEGARVRVDWRAPGWVNVFKYQLIGSGKGPVIVVVNPNPNALYRCCRGPDTDGVGLAHYQRHGAHGAAIVVVARGVGRAVGQHGTGHRYVENGHAEGGGLGVAGIARRAAGGNKTGGLGLRYLRASHGEYYPGQSWPASQPRM